MTNKIAKQLTDPQRRSIRTALDILLHETETRGVYRYETGWSDEKLAASENVSVNQVAKIRYSVYGRLSTPRTNEKSRLEDRVQALEDQVTMLQAAMAGVAPAKYERNIPITNGHTNGTSHANGMSQPQLDFAR